MVLLSSLCDQRIRESFEEKAAKMSFEELQNCVYKRNR